MTRALIPEEMTTARVAPVVGAVRLAGGARRTAAPPYALLWRAGVLTIPEIGGS
jgi:hypothetical protein